MNLVIIVVVNILAVGYATPDQEAGLKVEDLAIRKWRKGRRNTCVKMNQGAKCIRGKRCKGGFEACPGKFSCGKKKTVCCCPKTEPTPNPKTEPTTAPTTVRTAEPTTAKPTTELMILSECQDALGMESGEISNGQVSASSEWDGNHAAIQARLYFEAAPGKAGSWSAKYNNLDQWLQIDLGSKHEVTGLATQGRNGYDQWVTKYKVQYSVNGVNFQYYMEQGQAAIKEFVGNADQDTVVYQKLSHAIKARYVRFRPTAWHGHISMRVEVYGCKECQDALGMESGEISNGQVSASSERDGNHAAIQARLYFEAAPAKAGSWSAKYNNLDQWLQIDLGSKHEVTGLATQGRNGYGQWVTKYKVQYSDNGVNFQYYIYMEQGQTAIKEFVGNADQDTVVYYKLSHAIKARYIRFQPTAWHSNISMRVEVYGCQECQDALGMESGEISNGQVSASSEWDGNHAAIQARLYFEAAPGKAGSWSAKYNNLDQWLQIDLGSKHEVTGLATQGRNGYGQWVTKYKVQYSDNGVNVQYYMEQGQAAVKEFVGNADQDTVVYHKLSHAIRARYIRFRPTAWHGHISMRVEVYGCKGCQGALGMESGEISNGQVSASSEWDGNHAAIQARLYFEAALGKAGSWSAKYNNLDQWLQIDLGSKHTLVTGLATQGRNGYGQWVTKYKVQYSNNGVNFQYYMEQGQAAIKEFVGNADQDTVVYHKLSHAIKARYIRFQPTAWHGNISMRVEVYGCQECQDALGMESGEISNGQVSASSEWDGNHAAIQARLYFEAAHGKAGSWSAKYNNLDQWLQIDLGSKHEVTGLATQGRNGYGQWVTKYKVQYCDNGVNFQYYMEQGQAAIKEFVGNADQDTVVYHKLSHAIRARYIRFRPTAWHGHISMRVEVYGCKDGATWGR
ncbi:EGF-like repeat and discoidin I-like domain-containing protein 3 [Porites harrisoni]